MDNYPKEPIPDSSNLFYRIHKSFIIDGDIIPGAFQCKIDGMSTDWDRYSTAEQSLALSKIPSDNGIVKLSVRSIRQYPSMDVDHDPLPANRAHSLVHGIPENGELKTKVRLLLKRISVWEIKYNPN
jgi:hypothetical protein